MDKQEDWQWEDPDWTPQHSQSNPMTSVELRMPLPNPRCWQDGSPPTRPAETQSPPQPTGAMAGNPGALPRPRGARASPRGRRRGWSHLPAAPADVERQDDTHRAIPRTR